VRKLVDRIAKHPAPVSANRALASIKTFFAFAVEQDLIPVFASVARRRPTACGVFSLRPVIALTRPFVFGLAGGGARRHIGMVFISATSHYPRMRLF
jgi:hypothetical protein